jgi:hypothetical protein
MIIKTMWPSVNSRQIEQKNRTETTASANQCVYGANMTQWERISTNDHGTIRCPHAKEGIFYLYPTPFIKT